MHQQAILVTGNANLGSAGTLVSIDDVEKHYPTTIAANAAAIYKCADPKCGIPVIAVITKLTKTARRSSPSSHFRANRIKPHVKGCTREPSTVVPIAPSHGGLVNPASPSRTNSPVVWLDPLSRVVGSTAASSATGISSSGPRATRGNSGSGTSQGQSQMVESFAKKWLAMNAQIQRLSALTAPWNPQGTYYTAFHVLAYAHHQPMDVSAADQKIYVGMLKQIAKAASGHIVSLSEVNSTGEALEVFIPSSVLLFGTPGATLSSKLAGLVSAMKTTQVFVLGTFSRIKSGTLSLSVVHPHYIYIP